MREGWLSSFISASSRLSSGLGSVLRVSSRRRLFKQLRSSFLPTVGIFTSIKFGLRIYVTLIACSRSCSYVHRSCSHPASLVIRVSGTTSHRLTQSALVPTCTSLPAPPSVSCVIYDLLTWYIAVCIAPVPIPLASSHTYTLSLLCYINLLVSVMLRLVS